MILPRRLQNLHDLLDGKPYVHALEVYRNLRGKPWPGPIRQCQQHLGSTITRYNRTSPHRIVPGPEAYTYTLVKE